MCCGTFFRDRVVPFWELLRDHFYDLIVNATKAKKLVGRAVVGLLRIAIRLLRREEISPQVRATNDIVDFPHLYLFLYPSPSLNERVVELDTVSLCLDIANVQLEKGIMCWTTLLQDSAFCIL